MRVELSGLSIPDTKDISSMWSKVGVRGQPIEPMTTSDIPFILGHLHMYMEIPHDSLPVMGRRQCVPSVYVTCLDPA